MITATKSVCLEDDLEEPDDWDVVSVIEGSGEFVGSSVGSSSEERRKLAECTELAVRYKQGDEEALVKLMGNLAGYIPRVAWREYSKRRFRKRKIVSYDEIEGCVQRAAFETARNWDVTKTNCFNTYFGWYVKREIMQLQRENFGATDRYYQIPESTLSSRDSDRGIDNSSGRSFLEVMDSRRRGSPSERVDTRALLPEQHNLDYEFLIESVRKVLCDFSPRDREIAYLRYGRGMALEEIGERLDVTRERIHQLLFKRINKRLAEGIKASVVDFNLKALSCFIREEYEGNPDCVLPVETRDSRTLALRDDYLAYLALRRSGFRRGASNPIQALDFFSRPVVKGVLLDMSKDRVSTPYREFVDRGFWRILINEYGSLGELVPKVAPEIVHRLPRIHKWQKKETSVKTALNAIARVLYKINGYREAEERGDREGQVDLLVKFLEEQRNVTGYFEERDLGPLMKSFYDPKGIYGLDKVGSYCAVFRFYNRYLGFDWFNRSLGNWIPRYLMTERVMWESEDAADIGDEAIAHNLYKYPGYRVAEERGYREAQLRALDINLFRNPEGKRLFKRRLAGVMRRLIDPTGVNGLRKLNSVYEALRFHSGKNDLFWMDTDQEFGYIGGDGGYLGLVCHDPFDNLCAREKEVLFLRYERDMSQTQIAEAIQVSRRQVKKCLVAYSSHYERFEDRLRSWHEENKAA